jgi:catechol 1,2-dioxygenase
VPRPIIIDAASDYLDSDAVFAVKPSLLRAFELRHARDPETPRGVAGPWYSVEYDIVLAPGDDAREPSGPGRTA